MSTTIRICWNPEAHRHEITVGDIRFPLRSMETGWEPLPPDGTAVLRVCLADDHSVRLLCEANRVGIPPEVDLEGWLWWQLPSGQIVYEDDPDQ